eukprot:TRINITY_DN6153_c0_g5_i1.p1 TRINITY_DN6153_c0_g5~~TRINITY_DN6153_c0_g5_i1.p1  ORF type:complete len:295 (+),score=28.03 TRINITY_DN6153_c0_g5_i1:848-1732(+)
MRRVFFRFLWGLYSISCISLTIGALNIPSDFQLKHSAPGYALYANDAADSYIQVVKPREGGRIRSHIGDITHISKLRGPYGGEIPSIHRENIHQAFEKAKRAHSPKQEFHCITNGQFFAMGNINSQMAFPIKLNGKLLEGYASLQQHRKRLMLELYEDKFEMKFLTPLTCQMSNASDWISGLAEDDYIDKDRRCGRNMLGVVDEDGDGMYETALIYLTKEKSQPEAVADLKTFGAKMVMMVDGGGSTQLLCNGEAKDLLYTKRAVPHFIVTYSVKKEQSVHRVLLMKSDLVVRV